MTDRDSIRWMGMTEDGGLAFVEAPNPFYGATPAAQDTRSKRRFREHSTPHCELTIPDPDARAERYLDHRLYRCKCGWFGWLIPKENNG